MCFGELDWTPFRWSSITGVYEMELISKVAVLSRNRLVQFTSLDLMQTLPFISRKKHLFLGNVNFPRRTMGVGEWLLVLTFYFGQDMDDDAAL